MIRFDRVFKRYPNGREALSELSFELETGEMAFLTGPSGAGSIRTSTSRAPPPLRTISGWKLLASASSLPSRAAIDAPTRPSSSVTTPATMPRDIFQRSGPAHEAKLAELMARAGCHQFETHVRRRHDHASGPGVPVDGGGRGTDPRGEP